MGQAGRRRWVFYDSDGNIFHILEIDQESLFDRSGRPNSKVRALLALIEKASEVRALRVDR